MNPTQERIIAQGQAIFARMQSGSSGHFGDRGLTDLLMDWSMRNEDLKVQLFRLVDVLPALSSPREVAQHAQEYLGQGVPGLPAFMRWGVRLSPVFPWLTAWVARHGVTRMAGRFIVARAGKEALPALRRMRARPIAFTVDILGETAVSEKEAVQYQQLYLNLIETLAGEVVQWPPLSRLDRDDRGEIPRANVSVKISALCSQIKATDPEGALLVLSDRVRPLLQRAQELGVFINFDMESTALKDVTIELFRRLLDEPGLRDYRHAGIAIQAYLRSSEHDLRQLIAWAKQGGRQITVRLIKGAYWDTETVLARQRGWPVPVFEHKSETDANYEKLSRLILENRAWINPAFGTHSVRSIASCLVQAQELGLPPNSFEFQMLYGMAQPIKEALLDMGYRLREYCPVGEILPGMSYLVRRLLENTSNEGFLRATFKENTSPRELLKDPTAISRPLRTRSGATQFQNQPLTDFTRARARQEMDDALARVKTQLGRRYAVVISGKKLYPGTELRSINPARPKEVVGYVAKAGVAEAELAVTAARRASAAWKRTTIEERAALLERVAAIFCRDRFRLAAWEVFETGKPWVESDADVAEAIDFCNFYAAEMRRLGSRQVAIPGETSLHHYLPRGVAVVIAPWNFPLAILCGMTVAALVAGNCVIMKPAEQSSVVASFLMEALREAGAPPDVVHFLPGAGEEIGPFLVEHVAVDLIAFTGSRDVGLKIYEAAGRYHPSQVQLKKVICEMGGKNAVIVDSDADLDEAVPAIIASAFGYQGQKCSALSRLIVLPGCYDRLVKRLVEATENLQVGFPENPGTLVGPLIDHNAYQRVQEFIQVGKQEARLAFEGKVPSSEGFFVAPTIFSHVPPASRLAQEEIFGPVLAVLSARDVDEALAMANDSRYALTGGFFSRSPANIARVAAEMDVGNLYINRTITGALVGRHPFGGHKLSGGGTKAGGADYLQHFMFPRVVTENRMRRGFAPGDAAAE